MERIDMTDKFFHAIEFDSDDSNYRLEILDKILKCGYLLSPKARGIESSYGDKIFLSVYPNGKYSSKYEGTDYARQFFKYDGYDMSSMAFHFILDARLQDENSLAAGNYPNECYLLTKLDLYKYLVGICDPYFCINSYLICLYHITKCIRGEIDIDELVTQIYESHYPYKKPAKRIAKDILSDIRNAENYDKLLPEEDAEPQKLIRYGDYYRIKEIFEANGKTIDFFDNFGYPIIVEDEIQKVKKMKLYLEKNKFSYRDYYDGLTDIINKLE